MIAEPILLVDDEPELRVPLRHSLEADGYTIEEAESAAMALAMQAKKHYAVIVTDLYMPGGPSGLDLISAVKVKDPYALCVVITGYASLDVSIRALKCGAYDFVQKPFKLVEIEAVLDRALEHGRVQQQLRAHQENLESLVLERTSELQAFHQEVLRLNELLLEAQGNLDEQPLLKPFLDYLQARFCLDAYGFFTTDETGGWMRILEFGQRPWFPEATLPSPEEAQEWTWEGGYPDGHLVPIFRGENLLGMLYLGFEKRSAFHTQDPSFLFWKAQLEAALHGLRCARGHAVFEVAKAMGWE